MELQRTQIVHGWVQPLSEIANKGHIHPVTEVRLF